MKMTLAYMSVNDLLLDDENPRLPETLKSRTPKALTEWMANEYNTLEVAQSIAEHGYFDSEPMIAIKCGSKFKVVEGNRRLTALKVLLDGALRKSLDLVERNEWDQYAEDVDTADQFPVHIAKTRQAVAPIIGYRHIAGIEPWEPWAKARFIAKQVEEEKQSFAAVARIVGEDESDVRAHYRNYRVAVDAERTLKVPATRVKQNFGFFTRAMNSASLRAHIKAPAPAEVKPRKPVLKPGSKKAVAEVFSWLFGDGREDAVISESRQISQLGSVIASPDALKVLRESRDLEEALMASGGVRARLLKRLNSALTALQKAELDINPFQKDDEVRNIIDQCSEALARLNA